MAVTGFEVHKKDNIMTFVDMFYKLTHHAVLDGKHLRLLPVLLKKRRLHTELDGCPLLDDGSTVVTFLFQSLFYPIQFVRN